MQEKPDLAALIGSRICHDLISPIGAIGNGVELLMMERISTSPELALIAESVAHANARLRYFRIAFGATTANPRIARGEVMAVLADSLRSGRMQVEWESPPELSRREVKLAFLLLQCVESAMAYGGKVQIQQLDDGSWRIRAEAQRLRMELDLWGLLSEAGLNGSIAPAQVQFALAQEELRRQNRRLEAELKEQSIRLEF